MCVDVDKYSHKIIDSFRENKFKSTLDLNFDVYNYNYLMSLVIVVLRIAKVPSPLLPRPQPPSGAILRPLGLLNFEPRATCGVVFVGWCALSRIYTSD